MPEARPGESRELYNDACLVQLVKSAPGRDESFRGLPRINVSPCGLVVTLPGVVPGPEVRDNIDVAVRGLPGVRGSVNKLRVSEEDEVSVFPRGGCGVSRL